MLTAKVQWVSSIEAAEIIGCSDAHVRRLCAAKTLRAEHISGVWMIDRQSVEDFAATEQTTGRPRGS